MWTEITAIRYVIIVFCVASGKKDLYEYFERIEAHIQVNYPDLCQARSQDDDLKGVRG